MPVATPTKFGRSTRRAFLFAGPLVFAGGCTLRRRHAERQVKQLGHVDPTQHREMALTAHPMHVIEPSDTLEVRVRPDSIVGIPLDSVVAADGTIDLSFAGRVYVAGLPLDQAEAVIAQRLTEFAAARKMKLSEPVEVVVRPEEIKSKYYYVLGKGVSPAKLPVTGRDTVLEAILASQVKSNAMLEKAYVVRPHPMGLPDQVLAVDWIAIRDRGDVTTNYQLFPGDRLVIPGGPEPGLIETLFGSLR
ncbi:polysaccharide export protein [bacterium]|nr:polysaccharide export protein [bacterium]